MTHIWKGQWKPSSATWLCCFTVKFILVLMWEFQTNSMRNAKCVLKMMHLILKSTSQEIQCRMDGSPETKPLFFPLHKLQLFSPLWHRRLLVNTWQPPPSFPPPSFPCRVNLHFRDIFGKRRSGPETSQMIWKCTDKLWRGQQILHIKMWTMKMTSWDTGWPQLSGRAVCIAGSRGKEGGGWRRGWQRLQRRWDTSGSGRLGVACPCPGLWLSTGT